MDALRQNGPYNYGTHWGISPYESHFGVQPYWNPYHGSMGVGATDPGVGDDLGQTSVLHILVAAGIGGAVAGFSSWDLSRAAVGAAALGGLAAGYDGVTGLTGGKSALGMALLAVGALSVFVAYTSARNWNKRHVHYSSGAHSYGS
jgi:hypothetical protein